MLKTMTYFFVAFYDYRDFLIPFSNLVMPFKMNVEIPKKNLVAIELSRYFMMH